MLLLRFAYRVYRSRVLFSKGSHQIPVAIVGAGAAGVQLLDELQSNPDSRYSVQCFFDDDLGKLGKRIHGVEVKGTISQVQERLRAMDHCGDSICGGKPPPRDFTETVRPRADQNFCFAQYTGHDPPKADALSTARGPH